MHYNRTIWVPLSLLAALVGCSGTVGQPKSRVGTENGGATNGEPGGDNGASNGEASGASDGSDEDSGTGAPGAPGGGVTGGTPPAPVGEVSYPCPAAESKSFVQYVCDCGEGAAEGCVPGNDTNSGGTPATPWRSYEKARATFETMAPGGTIAFCRGGAFTVGENNRWVNARCQAGNRCIVRDYKPTWGSDKTGAPIINVGSSERVFSFDNPAAPAHEEGYVFANLSLRGTGKGTGFFFYNDTDDVTICSTSFDRLAIGVHTEGSNPGPGDTRNERIVVLGNRFTNNTSFGYLGGCDNCVVQDNYFANNGSQAVFDHNLYLGNGGNQGKPFVNMRVSGNELFRSTFIDGQCQGISFVVHGLYDNLLIENNYVHENIGEASGNCWGIVVDAGDSDYEGFRNVTIRGNRVENVGGEFIGLNACENCVVEDNVLVNTQPKSDAFGIMAPDRSREDPDVPMTAITVRNNSIFFGAGIGTAIRVGTEGSKHIVASNAVHYSGSGDFACFDLDLPKSAYSTVDNNLCFTPNSKARWENQAGSLATWQAASGFDQKSTTKDPGFASLIAPFNLAAASKIATMVDRGHATQSSPVAIDGKDRTTTPDIGAYEH